MCTPRAGLPLTLAAVSALAVAGLVAKRGSAARAEFTGGSRPSRPDLRDVQMGAREDLSDPGVPEPLCTCGMPESMHGPLEHAFDPAPDRAPENPIRKTYGGEHAVSGFDLRRYGMSDAEVRQHVADLPRRSARVSASERGSKRGSRSADEPAGLDRHSFASYALAREMLDDFGWVETARSVPRGWKRPEIVEFFNKNVGGVGRLVAETDDPKSGSYDFFGPENWVGRVLRKRYEEPSGSRSIPPVGRGRASFSVPGKLGKAVHPWFSFSAWQSSNHTDKQAARALSGIVGFDVAKRYAEPGVDPWFWDDEIEGTILHRYGHPPAFPQSGPSIGRRPHPGSANEADAMREALAILEEHPQRVATAYRAFMKAKGLKAKAWSSMSSGMKATITMMLLDNARIARAFLKK